MCQIFLLAPILRWFRDGQILHTKDDLLLAVQEKAQSADWLKAIPADDVYAAWFRINYNLAHARRMIQSDDLLYQQVVNIRMVVYGTSDLWFGYFTLRKIPWSGDKDAVRYLSRNDPEFLDAFQQFVISIQSPLSRFEAYHKAAQLAAAPLGGLWPAAITIMNIPDMTELWEQLLQGKG